MKAESGRARQVELPLSTRIAFRITRPILLLLLRMFYRIERQGGDRIPPSGPLIVISNHQSYLDPIIVGLLAWRRVFRSIARSGLFDFRPFGRLIRIYGAIPIRQGKGDREAMRISIEQVKRGHAMLFFPEGGRTLTGSVQPFQRGFMLVWKKTRATMIPVAIEGAFDIWPRGQRFPRLTGRIIVRSGEPIPYDAVEGIDEAEVMADLQQWIESTRRELRAEIRRKSSGRFPRERSGNDS